MAEKLDPKEIVTLEELAISSMWEMAALVEVLEKKGLLTKQDLLDDILALLNKHWFSMHQSQTLFGLSGRVN